MQRFPSEIIKSMRLSGAMTTCLPVQLDSGAWQTAVFFELGGAECEADRNILKTNQSPLSVSLEADIIEAETAAVVMLRFEVMTNNENPLVGEVLVLPGMGNVQFETIDLLTQQDNLSFFFSDQNYKVIHTQQITLQDREHQGYQGILDDAIRHDAVIRLTGRYNAKSALKTVVGNYAKRVQTN